MTGSFCLNHIGACGVLTGGKPTARAKCREIQIKFIQPTFYFLQI